MQFTQDFFKPEIREEFEIPAMMKRAWAAQMEVLQVVADICEENGLQYFAVSLYCSGVICIFKPL